MTIMLRKGPGAAALKAAFLSAALLGASALTAVAQADDDKDDVVQTYDLNGFDEIDIAGVFDLSVEVGPDYSIRLSGPRREMDRIKAEVKGGALRLGPKERRKRPSWGNRDSIDAQITLPSLTAFSASGVVDGTILGVDAQDFVVDVSGVGDITLEGECGALSAQVSGVGDLDAKKLECRAVEIDVSGVGDATVYASESADASVSGVGDINIYGGPAEVRKDGGMFAEITVH